MLQHSLGMSCLVSKHIRMQSPGPFGIWSFGILDLDLLKFGVWAFLNFGIGFLDLEFWICDIFELEF